MPAYNPPPQVLFSPVSNFYQGKAIRQGLAAGEQDAELRDLQIEATQQEIDSAPARQDAANRDEQRKVDAAERAAQSSKWRLVKTIPEYLARALLLIQWQWKRALHQKNPAKSFGVR